MVTLILKDACTLMHYNAIVQLEIFQILFHMMAYSQVVIESDRLDVDKF